MDELGCLPSPAVNPRSALWAGVWQWLACGVRDCSGLLADIAGRTRLHPMEATRNKPLTTVASDAQSLGERVHPLRYAATAEQCCAGGLAGRKNTNESP